MIVTESRRARHLVVRLQRDEELPHALQRTLDEIEARSGFFTGLGTLDAVELAVVDPLGGAPRTRRIEGRCNVLSLTGNLATRGGAGSLRLAVTLARETDLGHELCGGELLWARAHGLELLVTALDNAPLARVDDPRSGATTLAAAPSRTIGAAAADPPAPEAPRAAEPARAAEPTRALEPTRAAEPARAPEPPRAPAPRADPPRAEPARTAPRMPEIIRVERADRAEPAREAPYAPDPPRADPPRVDPPRADPPPRATPQPTVEVHTPPAPLRRRARDDSTEIYPEVGDRATHFHFGECTIIASDGERIRLRQERDGRVREVSLEMLKIEPPTVDPGTGQRSFVLARKH